MKITTLLYSIKNVSSAETNMDVTFPDNKNDGKELFPNVESDDDIKNAKSGEKFLKMYDIELWRHFS